MALTQVQTAMLGTGAVLQVVNATYSTVTTVSNTTYVSTGLTSTITPKFSNSKILIIATCTTFTSGSATGLSFRIVRGSTDIWTSPNYSSYSSSGGGLIATNTLNWLDSPATTSATSYTLQFNSPGGAQTAQYGSAPSSIILMEIAA
jgi:hypothetical protein